MEMIKPQSFARIKQNWPSRKRSHRKKKSESAHSFAFLLPTTCSLKIPLTVLSSSKFVPRERVSNTEKASTSYLVQHILE